MQTLCLLMNDLWTRHSYKITFLFHNSAPLLLVRHEVGKLVTELFPCEEFLLSKLYVRFKISVKVLLTLEAIYSGSRNNNNDVMLSAVAKY